MPAAGAEEKPLTPVEAFRAEVLLTEAIEKLNFLPVVSGTAQHSLAGLAAFTAGEVSRLTDGLRSLELEYRSLIREREELQCLSQKDARADMQEKMRDIAGRLRESSKALSRSLQETPNLQGNSQKLQTERIRVQELLESTKEELTNSRTFDSLREKVGHAREQLHLLSEVKRRATEVGKSVKALQYEVKKEYKDHAIEVQRGREEISALKAALSQKKEAAASTACYEARRLDARESALERRLVEERTDLEKELQTLKDQRELNASVCEIAKKALVSQTAQLIEDRVRLQKEWEDRLQFKREEVEELRVHHGRCECISASVCEGDSFLPALVCLSACLFASRRRLASVRVCACACIRVCVYVRVFPCWDAGLCMCFVSSIEHADSGDQTVPYIASASSWEMYSYRHTSWD
eukprot:GHVU01012983.1.p1 GENE.GHVU01012983.1~~GHVU01012983.1.p1  ORF type:complete len:447 (-),score=74.31 GHVU01012983.1:1451-2680(-)